ncbi:MAG TPA: phosphatidate cytidylyltransferase [Burkholderiaceae bacterium]|nr:phosphatidate cytidylyltransferase [Burkholderiaceae bacterium]
MLLQRVITAVVLLALLLPALLAHAVWPFALIVLAMLTAAGWEWARLNGLGGPAALALGAVLLGVGALALQRALAHPAPPWLWWAVLPCWVLGGALALRRGVPGWPLWPRALRLVLGVAILALAGVAMTQSKVIGVNFLLSVLCLVWVADIAAYFGGRAFGRRKLALSISPGKSWEGVWSGMVAVLLLAAGWLALDARGLGDSASVYSRMLQLWGWPGLVAGVLFLAGMSVVGDLFESLVKRSAGAKDSSALLPGHGGVLDRIDALLPVLPLALALTAGAA